MADYQHLAGVAERAKLQMAPESVLEDIAWNFCHSVRTYWLNIPLMLQYTSGPPSLPEIAGRLAEALHRSPRSVVLLNLAAIYWRMIGRPTAVSFVAIATLPLP